VRPISLCDPCPKCQVVWSFGVLANLHVDVRCLTLPPHLQALPLQQLQQAAAQLQRVGGLAGPGAAETAAAAAAAVAAAAAAGGAPGSSDVSGETHSF
jgi:hypothetical protein